MEILRNVNNVIDLDSFSKFLEEKLRDYPPILERKFKALSDTEAKNDSNRFRIMQWNILARALGYPEPDSTKPSYVYDWTNYRLWRTLQELTRYDSDIICIEEADVYEELKPYMNLLGYTSIFCPKYSSPCLEFPSNVGPDGCAIFYRLSLFQINSMSCEKIVLNKNDINSQVFIILQLKHKITNKLITIVCLHLKSKIENNLKREAQIQEVLKSISLHCSNLNIKTHPILICGDFNGQPFEKFYQLIIEDEIIEKLQDAYSLDVAKKEPTTLKVRSSNHISREIDYIFFNQNNLELCAYLELPKNENGTLDLPDTTYSSDHLSLVCDFKFQ